MDENEELFLEYALNKDKSTKVFTYNLDGIKSLEDISLIDRLKICLVGDVYYLYQLIYTSKDIDYNHFSDILKGSSLFPYLDLLVEYQNLYFCNIETKEDVAKSLNENYRDVSKEEILFSKLLLHINEKLNLSYGINITFTNSSKKKIDIRNNDYLQYIYDATVKFYEDKGYNSQQLNRKEALKMMKKPIFRDDLIYSYKENGLPISNIDIKNIPESVIETFAGSITTQRKVTSDFLKAKISDSEQMLAACEKRAKVGRKYINKQIAIFVLNLSYLIRFDEFIHQNTYDDIFDMKIKNEELSLLFEYVTFWGMKNSEDIASGYNNVDNWIRKVKSSNPELRYSVNVTTINNIRTTIRKHQNKITL